MQTCTHGGRMSLDFGRHFNAILSVPSVLCIKYNNIIHACKGKCKAHIQLCKTCIAWHIQFCIRNMHISCACANITGHSSYE